MPLLVFKKFTLKEATTTMASLEKWFNKHPNRKVCHTDLFKVRRGHIVEDVLKHTNVEEDNDAES